MVITGHFGGEPEMVSPRFELMGAQDPPNRFRGNAMDDTVGFQLASQFRTIPTFESEQLMSSGLSQASLTM